MPCHRSKKVLFWPYLSFCTKKKFSGGGGGWKVTSVSVYVHFWTFRHTDTKLTQSLTILKFDLMWGDMFECLMLWWNFWSEYCDQSDHDRVSKQHKQNFQLYSFTTYQNFHSFIPSFINKKKIWNCHVWSFYSRFTKNRNNLRINYRGEGRFWSYFRGKNRPIYMAYCSFLVLDGPLDTGSRPRIVKQVEMHQNIPISLEWCFGEQLSSVESEIVNRQVFQSKLIF